jgi:hypothetical protein
MSGSSLAGALLRGAVSGGIATWVMDVVTTRVQNRQSKADAQREAAARPNGQSSVANLIDLAAAQLGVALNQRQRDAVITVTHYLLGVLPGAGYAVLRGRVPMLGAGRGLVFGIVLWAVNDEWLNTALGTAGPPGAYPLSSHIRGLIGHAALGVATDVGIDVLGTT